MFRKIAWSRVVLVFLISVNLVVYTLLNLFIDALHVSVSLFSVMIILLPLVLSGCLLAGVQRLGRKPMSNKQILIVTVAGILVMGYSASKVIYHESSARFTEERWVKEVEQRVYMVDNLLARTPLSGWHRSEVLKLIGEPTDTAYFQQPQRDVYYLGPERGIIRIDSEWLVIDYDEENRVSAYAVMTD